nr:immunoglobulin light chain junction region [Macaca mulatta]
YQQNRNWPFTF